VIKLFVFLKRSAALSHHEFCNRWAEFGRRVLELPELDATVRRLVQNRAIQGASVPELTFSDFDGVGELWFDSLGDLEAAIGSAAYRAALESAAAELFDRERLILLAAEESVQFDRGFGAVKFIGLSRRSSGFATREDWIRYWIDVHGPLAHEIPEFTRYYGKYVHNYVVPSDVASGGRQPEFDGIVEEWLESVEDFARCLAEPKYLELVRPDEIAFVDFSRSHMMVTEEQVIRAGRS